MCQNVPPLTISNKGTSYLSYFSRVALLYMQSILTERTWQRIPIEQISDDSFYDWLIQSYAIGACIFDYSQCFSFQNQPIWCESIKILLYLICEISTHSLAISEVSQHLHMYLEHPTYVRMRHNIMMDGWIDR